jgi:hypothetical protein
VSKKAKHIQTYLGKFWTILELLLPTLVA